MEPGFAAWIVAPLLTWLSAWLVLLRQALVPLGAALAFVALCTAIEWLAPAEPGQGLRGRLRNLVYLAFFQLFGLAALAIWLLLGPAIGRHAHAPTALEATLLVAANLFTIDLVYYWYHRAQHRFPALWAIHELHHADAQLNATSSFRTFWLELPVQAIAVISPSLILFGDQGAVHALGLLVGSYLFLIFSHCNFRLALGPFSLVVCGPQVHRIHHSRLPQHRDRNFAQYFPVIDRLFGTYYRPARDEFPPTGADGLASDAPIAAALTRPFRIWRSGMGLAPDGPRARSSRPARRRRHG